MGTIPGARISSLREILLAVSAGTENHAQLNTLVSICHALATAHLAGKRTAWQMSEFHSINTSDLAYDCIGDLFRRDARDTLIEIKVYFEAYNLRSAEESELLAALRRLVCSKSNSRLFRLVGEADSSLARIIRNIKAGVHVSPHFEEAQHFGEQFIVPAGMQANQQLPLVTLEELEQYMWEIIPAPLLIPELLARLCRVLAEQQKHSREVPLFLLAIAIRNVIGKQLPSPPAHENQDRAEADALEILDEAVSSAKEKFSETYVATGKVTATMLHTYLESIHDLLEARILQQDGHDSSIFKSLLDHLPDMTEEEYRAAHKARIEYIARYVQQRIAGHMQQ